MVSREKLLKDILVEAGDLLRDLYHKRKTLHYKRPRDVVTNADHAVEKLVFDRVAQAGFDDHFICEESGYTDHWGAKAGKARPFNEGYTWVVDPVDGTSNFAHENPLFCTSIGIQHNNRVEIAGVYLPMLDELFFAQRGKGAFLNGKPIRVSKTDRFYDLVIAVERQPDKKLVESSLVVEEPIAFHHRLRTLGSVAIDLCFTAAGRFDGFFSNSIFIWDCSAGLLLIEEAGGKASHLDGKPVNVFERKFGLAASNSRIHASFIRALGKQSRLHARR